METFSLPIRQGPNTSAALDTCEGTKSVSISHHFGTWNTHALSVFLQPEPSLQGLFGARSRPSTIGVVVGKLGGGLADGLLRRLTHQWTWQSWKRSGTVCVAFFFPHDAHQALISGLWSFFGNLCCLVFNGNQKRRFGGSPKKEKNQPHLGIVKKPKMRGTR